MSTRKIKDAKDLTTGEKIYFKGHAKATFLSDGRTVEDAIASDAGGEGSGITIVDSVDQLDPNAELGSLASVVEPGSITETLISELPQPDSSIINMDTGFIDATSCPQVSGLSIIVPEGPIPVSMELTENEMLFFCSESLDLNNMTTGIALGIFPQIVNNEIIALAGMYMNVTTMEEKQWAFFTIQDGVVSVDQAAIDECNAYIKDLYYIGAMQYVMQGMSLTTEKLLVYDNVVKAMAGIPSKARVYLKKDNWEELYAKDFNRVLNRIDAVGSDLSSLSEHVDNETNYLRREIDKKTDKMPIVTPAYYSNVVRPNEYTKRSISTTGQVAVELATSADATIYNEYILELKCTSTPSSVIFRYADGSGKTIVWANDEAPTFEAGMTYLISIANGLAVYAMFTNS